MTGEIATIICALIAAASAITVAIVEKRADKDRKRSQARADRRERESRLSMELMSATCELSVVTATAMREGHTNGTLEPALKKAEKAQGDYENFLRDVTARDMAKV